MGTRGLWGFRHKGEDKLTYNHWDSHPDGLGEWVVDFVRTSSLKELREIEGRILLVKTNSKPTKEQQRECEEYANLGVDEQRRDSWYCLLRETQGKPHVYKDGVNKKGLRYMIDDREFIKDSLFCEWGYIINLDTKRLEVWEGFQTTPQKGNRYGESELKCSKGYYPCALVLEMPLDDIPKDWIKLIT